MLYKFCSLFINLEFPQRIEIFSKDFYLDKIYTDISFPEILVITLVTMLFSVFSAVIPAIKAGRIKPCEVLKNE